MARRARGKHNKTVANETGGRPAEEMPLSTTEQQVELTFCDEQIIGTPEYDTLEHPGAEPAEQGMYTTGQTCFSHKEVFCLPN